MIELAAFLLFQSVINLLVKRFLYSKAQYVFASLAYIIFGLLVLAYPFISITFYYDAFYEEGDIKCGNADLGIIVFFWIIGIPLVFLIQFLFNKFLFRRIIEKS